MSSMYLPRRQMTLENLLAQSLIDPIRMPAAETLYPPIATKDGKPMNAMHDHFIWMSKNEGRSAPGDGILAGHPV